MEEDVGSRAIGEFRLKERKTVRDEEIENFLVKMRHGRHPENATKVIY